MIESALYLRVPLDKLVEMDRHNTIAKTRLRNLKISAKEWDMLSQTTKVLSVRIQELLFLIYDTDMSSFSPFLRPHSDSHRKKDPCSIK
jgi:hypothetical protein